MQDVERVILAAEAVSGDHDKAVWWMSQSLASFGGKAPLQRIAEGRIESLIGYIQSVESGYVG